MRKFYPLIILLFLFHSGFSQGFVHNNGAEIYVTAGGVMIIKTDSLINSLNGNSGLIDNKGLIVVEGNIHNDAIINAAGDSIKLTGDWINNKAYTGNNSWVDFYGGDQLITGSSVTTFNNLRTEGGQVIKRQTLNAITTGLLQLTDAELATDSNQMLVTNTDTAAITWNLGFVSSVDTGRLARATNSTQGYVFPMGSPSYINAPTIFRPVQMNPASIGTNTYAACLVKGDATNDGYDVKEMDTSLCVVNPNFYHRLYHVDGSDAVALAMYYDPTADGGWNDEAHWKNSIWNNIGPATTGSGLGLSTVTVTAVSDFVPNPFALAQTRFSVDPGPTLKVSAGTAQALNVTIVAPSNTTVVWSPDSALSCTNCPNPTVTPFVNMHYTITVTDHEGCVVTDTLDIEVDGKFLMPDAFTPNGDGKDDLFGPVTANHSTIKAFRIYNRWGQLIHDSNSYWDGKFKGQDQQPGTFLYYIEVESPDPNNPTVMVPTKQEGSVVLLR